MIILAGDIGGTKTHLALFAERRKILAEKKFASKEYTSLLDIVKEFLSEHAVTVSRACFGIAGPIVHGRCTATNLPWVIETSTLIQELGIKQLFLINDLVANAYGLRCLAPDEFALINRGSPESLGNQALISAGTGLGEAGLFWDGKEHQPFSSEGGHTDFGPRDELEMELLRYLKERFGNHASYERILSGPGLYNLYHFLIDMNLEKPSDAVTQALAKGDPARTITEQALKNENKTCVRTLEWFSSLYGAECGNAALKFLATGGVFLGGGIAPKILPFLQKNGFMKSFTAKGRFSTLLSQIPIKVVLNPNTALLGAEYFAEKYDFC
jgi:glucokinase